MFALQVTDKKTKVSRLVLNPASYCIPSQDLYDVEAFVIAKNQADSDLSFSNSSNDDAVGLQAINRNIGNLANIMKSNVPERRKSSVRDASKLTSLNSFAAKLEGLEEGESEKEPTKKESKWKHLKRSALLERKVKLDSFQEVMHRLEDDHFNQSYYVRATPVDLHQITVKTSVTEEVPYINNHLIVIGKGLRNLYDLIKPLRAKYLGPLRHIVVLYPYDIPHDVWQRISIFDAVLFVRGSPLEDSNLRRAGIFRAATVVVLADGSSEVSSNKLEALVDSDAIFSYQHVKRMNPTTQVVVEIVNQSNIGYLEDGSVPILVDDPKFSPQFAAGSLFTTALLDSIVCQAYYNPQIVKVINKLITGVDQVERSELMEKAGLELGFIDKNKVDESSDSDEDNQSSKDLQMQRARRKLLKIPNSCLYQISLPDNLPQKTYGALYQFLSVQGIIPLGVLRGTFSNIAMGPKSNRMPYVYTNPDKDTELYTCDRIFVLSTKPEKLNQKLEIKVSLNCFLILIVTVLTYRLPLLLGLVVESSEAEECEVRGSI